MKNDDPPNSFKRTLINVGMIMICVLFWVLFGWMFFKVVEYYFYPTTAKILKFELKNVFQIVGGDSVKAITPPVHIKPQVLGIMANGLSIQEAELLNKIAECESGWRNICNQKYGCGAGQGVFQLIPKTVKTCEKNLGKKIDPFNKEDSIECASWLLKETSQGYYHWGYPDGHPNAYHKGIRWGSYHCFKDYIN